MKVAFLHLLTYCLSLLLLGHLLERHQRVRALLAQLCEKFPLAFRPRQAPPPWPALKIGIDRDILERIPVSRRLLKAALRYHTSCPSYRAGLIAGAVRVDLDGVPAGEVTKEHTFEAP